MAERYVTIETTTGVRTAKTLAIPTIYAPGRGIYGNGADGSLSLGVNTILSANDNVRRYTSLTLNNYYIMQNSADPNFTLYANSTIQTNATGAVQPYWDLSGYGVGGTSVNSSGAGGHGYYGRWGLFIYAYTVQGTGSFNADGGNGTNGGTAANGAANTNGNQGSNGSSNPYIFGQSSASGIPGGGNFGYTSQTGGGYTATTQPYSTLRVFKDITKFLNITGDDGTIGLNMSHFRSPYAAGGGSGGSKIAGNTPSAGGGGGGAGSAFAGTGGYGGAGGTGTTSAGGAGGGGGGGGSAASLVFAMTQTTNPTVTVRAQGGYGGNGGDSNNTYGGKGGGGGGGSGGVAILIAPGTGGTVVAPAGLGGSTGTGNGQNGAAGGSGGSGIAMRLSV